jgi:hypothetical protein
MFLSRANPGTTGTMFFGDFFLLSVSGKSADESKLNDLLHWFAAPLFNFLEALRLFESVLVRSSGGRCVAFK